MNNSQSKGPVSRGLVTPLNVKSLSKKSSEKEGSTFRNEFEINYYQGCLIGEVILLNFIKINLKIGSFDYLL